MEQSAETIKKTVQIPSGEVIQSKVACSQMMRIKEEEKTMRKNDAEFPSIDHDKRSMKLWCNIFLYGENMHY